MSIITRIIGNEIAGFLPLSAPPNSPQPERVKDFEARLLFLDIEDGTQEEILPKLRQHHVPLKTRVEPFDEDGHFCVVLYERKKELGNEVHLPHILRMAKDYCQGAPRFRRIFTAEEFKKQFGMQFDVIVRKTLGMDVRI